MSQPVLRTKSLRIPAEALKAPIPPSLLESPHLNSPQSMFRRATSPRVPNIDDEWLQDTVPQHGALKPPKTKPSADLTRRPPQSALSLRQPSAPAKRPALPS
ncbi:Ubiquitin-conjugating enzyme E2 32 [Mycena sanguinolenta]|uniref:Ubiquitin-conjugating enzyme E2 32 n=1 Tax=Mycena sanguinolenta TaxID=230812 RepID=A0A8H6YIX1_9AGAR|nr:Ubiquitin-conjugating enzyme E2 32 [Mycena sanguinolenta]